MEPSQGGVGKSRASSSRTSIASEKEKQPSVSERSSQSQLKSEKEQLPNHLAEKAEAIRRACDLRDLDALVLYAGSEGGLLQDDLRRSACKLYFWAGLNISETG